MAIIDSQVHVYEANTPERPWHSVPNWPDHVTGDEMVAAMDKVGVDGAIFISAFTMYGYDASYAVEVPGPPGVPLNRPTPPKPHPPSPPPPPPPLGPARPCVRRLGLRPLLVGHRLDPRIRGRQLRTGRRALPSH